MKYKIFLLYYFYAFKMFEQCSDEGVREGGGERGLKEKGYIQKNLFDFFDPLPLSPFVQQSLEN